MSRKIILKINEEYYASRYPEWNSYIQEFKDEIRTSEIKEIVAQLNLPSPTRNIIFINDFIDVYIIEPEETIQIENQN